MGEGLRWCPLLHPWRQAESYRGAVTTRDSTGTSVGALARRGFGDATRAARLLADSGLADAAHDVIVDALCRAADPDLALFGLVRILERSADPAELLAALHEEADFRERLCQVVGASRALTDHLVRHPDDWRELRGADAARPPETEELRAGLLAVVGADPYSPTPVADLSMRDAAAATHALRLAYRRRVLRLAGRDLTGVQDLKEVAAELADLAAAVLEGALALAVPVSRRMRPAAGWR